MSYTEGDYVKDCSKCEKGKMFFVISFRDCFDYKSGHYTVDVPFLECSVCDYSEEFIPEEVKE